MKKNLFGIEVNDLKKSEIIEKIKIYIKKPMGFFHIVSLNPENIVIAQKNQEFKKVLQTAQIKIADGGGIFIASKLLSTPFGERITGVDLMQEMLALADRQRLRVMLIGGRPKVADKVIECQKQRYPCVKFFGLAGIKDIKNPQKEEEEKIFSIVVDVKPHFLFVAFGSPFQELWLAKHQRKFTGIVCMGVGGAFDYLSGAIPRAPLIMRKIGLEWLFRLFVQPRRIKRQLRLIKFIFLVLREMLYRFQMKLQ